MPLRANNTKSASRKLYAGVTERIRVLKRNDDQQQGTVTAYILCGCRRGAIQKRGETLQGDMVTGHSTVWHIPRSEMDRVGIKYFNPLDRIQQLEGREKDSYWQPEATTQIDIKLMGNEVDIVCLRCDPPQGS